jgi:DNA-binding transcriptional ArsR family regulator
MLVLNNVSSAAGKTQVRVIAGVELCLAMWAAVTPEPEPLSRAARRITASMPPCPRRTLAELNDGLPQWPLHVLNTFYRLGGHDLDDSLTAFAAQDPRDVALDVLRGFLPAGARLPASGRCGAVQDVLSGAGLAPDVARRVRRVIARPKALVVQILEVLTAFQDSGFGQWWDGHKDGMYRMAAFLDSQLTADLGTAAAMISPRVVGEPSLDRLTFVGGGDLQVVDCARFAGFDVLPSRWLRRRVVLHHADGRVGVAAGCGPALRAEFDQLPMTEMLTALGDARRLQILQLCVLRAHTTSELAPILGITEGPMSRHLKALERSGLISAERVGREVRYSTAIEILTMLGQRLQRLPQQAWTDSAPDRAMAMAGTA